MKSSASSNTNIPLLPKSYAGMWGNSSTFEHCILASMVPEHSQERNSQQTEADQCNLGFSFKINLQSHIRTVHRGIKRVHKKIHKCSLCPYATHVRCDLEAHIRRHTGERSFPCQHPSCEYTGKSSEDIRVHNNHKHTTVRNFLCPFPNCDYRGKTANVVRAHALSHNDYRPFVCNVNGCSYRAKRSCALKYHKQDVHHGGYKPFACSKCSFETTSKRCLKNHGLVHVEEKSIKCTFSGCSYSCKSKTNLRNHVVNHHQDKTFKCNFAECSATMASRSNLEWHRKVVHYEKVHTCPSCDYQAAFPSILQKHIIASHYASQRIPCPTKGCTFQAKHRESLRWHMAYHRTNLVCSAEGCAYVGVSSAGWKRHIKIHDPSGRPFRCPICPKYFPRSCQVSTHLRIHTKEKPFKCPICNFGSAAKPDITRHVRSIHSRILPKFLFDKDSNCDHCNVNFGCDVGLAIHRMKLKTVVVVLTRLQLIQQ